MKYIKTKDGRFAGSIGDGIDAPSTPKTRTVEVTEEQASTLIGLAAALEDSRPSVNPAFGEERFGQAELAREGMNKLHDKVFSARKSQGIYNDDDVESDLDMANFYFDTAMDGVSMTGFASDAEDGTIDEDDFVGDQRGETPVELVTYLTFKKVLADGEDAGEQETEAFAHIADRAGDEDETKYASAIDWALRELTDDEVRKLDEIYSDEDESRAFTNREEIFTKWQNRIYSPHDVNYETFQ